MPESAPIDIVKIRSDVRVYFDAIRFSTPMPSWWDREHINYGRIAKRIKPKIDDILSGGVLNSSSFMIDVPHRSGEYKKWIAPPITEQIMLQCCTSLLAPSLAEKALKPRHVFSYRYRRESSQPSFISNQLESWIAFQEETHKRLETNQFILQLDLKNAFANIDRDDYFAFLAEFSPHPTAIQLLKRLIAAWDRDGQGIPLVNDALFFLGNSYISKVDLLVAQYSQDFIRFVDDYRLFSNSRNELEEILEKVSRRLKQLGFTLNQQKIRLGSGTDYFKAINTVKYAEDMESEYLSAPLFADTIDPEQLFQLIKIALNNPERYITVGVGRLLITELRRLRTEEGNAAHDRFAETLVKDSVTRERIVELMTTYSGDQHENWRTVWLLYLAADLLLLKDKESSEFKLASKLSHSQTGHPLVRLWARRVLSPEKAMQPAKDFDTWFGLLELNYLEVGQTLYGG
ncbi:MAG: RNA-directed DNA polymerase [Desulfobacterales bacterium]|jgi:hypothetical protein